MSLVEKSPLPPAADATQAQLLAYARDFRKLADADREKALRLEGINRQLQIYARDLKTAFTNERRRARELERAYHDTVRRLVAASRYKDEETGQHTERVALYARELANYVGWHSAAVQLLQDAAPMHDGAAARFHGTIDLMVTDVVMPGMNGRELAEELLRARPQTRVLYISGYTGSAVAEQMALDASLAFLEKPFTWEAFARKVREVLEQPAAEPAAALADG